MSQSANTPSKTNAGNFFEDFRLGQQIRHATPRTLTLGDVAVYNGLFGPRFAVQSSDVFAQKIGYPRSPVDDLLVFHVVFGKTVPDISLNAVANLGYADCRFLTPVYPGDTINSVSEVIGLKENSNRKTGIVYVRSRGFKQNGDAVLDYARLGGRVTFMGISIGRKVPVELGKIQSKSLTIKGTIGSPGVWPAALRFLAQTKVDLSPIQTHFFDLAKGVEAFEFGKNPSACIVFLARSAMLSPKVRHSVYSMHTLFSPSPLGEEARMRPAKCAQKTLGRRLIGLDDNRNGMASTGFSVLPRELPGDPSRSPTLTGVRPRTVPPALT